MEIDDWVRRFLHGEDVAGAIIVSVLAPRLKALLRRRARDMSDADLEIAIETGITRGLAKLTFQDLEEKRDLERHFLAYAVYAIRDTRRRGRLDPVSEELLTAQGPYEYFNRLTEDDISRTRKAYDDCTPAERTLLHLRFVEQLTYAEIARRLDLKEGTCRMRMSRLLQRLRDQI